MATLLSGEFFLAALALALGLADVVTSYAGGGRLVSITFLVEELKSRIDVRLEVKKGDDGSRAKFVVW